MFIMMFMRRELTTSSPIHADVPSVQPVVHKETIVPEVVHTTIPIHEKHTAPSEHHGMSVLPTRSLNEFQQQGNSDTGATEIRHKKYEGDPRPYNATLQQEREPADIDPQAHDGMHDLESTGHSRPGTSNTDGVVGGISGGQSGALEGAASNTTGGVGSTEQDSAVGGSSGAQTGDLAGQGTPETSATTDNAARGTTGPQTGALAEVNAPSETTDNIDGAERNEAVGGSSGAQTGALAEAAGSAFGGGGVLHTDPVGDHSSITAPSGAGTVDHFRDDPVFAPQNTSTGVQEAGLKNPQPMLQTLHEPRESGVRYVLSHSSMFL